MWQSHTDLERRGGQSYSAYRSSSPGGSASRAGRGSALARRPARRLAAASDGTSSCEKTNSYSVGTHRNTPQVTYQTIFEPECTLTVTHDKGGTASQSAASVACGGSITATATANACYDFTGWTGDVTITSRSVGSTMDRSKSIHANFAHDGTKHTLTVRAHGGGTATGAGTHDCGTIVVAKGHGQPRLALQDVGTRPLRHEEHDARAHDEERLDRRAFRARYRRLGSFTVTGTGSSQSAAAGDTAGRAATEAARLGADRHWRTAISYQTTTSTTVTYRSTVTASWSRTGTTVGEAYGILPNSKGEASSVGLQVAVAAAKSRAYRGIPSDATFRGYLSTVSSGYNADAKLGPVGHWALAWARWVRTGRSRAVARARRRRPPSLLRWGTQDRRRPVCCRASRTARRRSRRRWSRSPPQRLHVGAVPCAGGRCTVWSRRRHRCRIRYPGPRAGTGIALRAATPQGGTSKRRFSILSSLVGDTGFEPVTSAMSTQRSNHLS